MRATWSATSAVAGLGSQKMPERLHAGRLVLPHDELSVPGARAPVDPAQRIARAIFADAEQLGPGSRPRSGHARLELSGLRPARERREARQHQRHLGVRARAAAAKQAGDVARLDHASARADRTAAQSLELDALLSIPTLEPSRSRQRSPLSRRCPPRERDRAAHRSCPARPPARDRRPRRAGARSGALRSRCAGRSSIGDSGDRARAAHVQVQQQAGPVPPRVHEAHDAQRDDPAREQEQPGDLRGRAVPLDHRGEGNRAEESRCGSQCCLSGGSGSEVTSSWIISSAFARPRMLRRCAMTGAASSFTSSGRTKSRPSKSAHA